jgi:hypothetical protein
LCPSPQNESLSGPDMKAYVFITAAPGRSTDIVNAVRRIKGVRSADIGARFGLVMHTGILALGARPGAAPGSEATQAPDTTRMTLIFAVFPGQTAATGDVKTAQQVGHRILRRGLEGPERPRQRPTEAGGRSAPRRAPRGRANRWTASSPSSAGRRAAARSTPPATPPGPRPASRKRMWTRSSGCSRRARRPSSSRWRIHGWATCAPRWSRPHAKQVLEAKLLPQL